MTVPTPTTVAEQAAFIDTLNQRLNANPAELQVTVATSKFVSAATEFASTTFDLHQEACSVRLARRFMDAKSYVAVPILTKPGTGENLVHQTLSNTRLNKPNRLCAATARLLDLQTLLELPLAILGIQLREEQGDSQQAYLWPDRAKVNSIEVVRINLNAAEDSTISVVALSSADLRKTIWEFVQPESNRIVIIHITPAVGKSLPSVEPDLREIIKKSRPRAPAPPRDSSFRDKVKPRYCVVTGCDDLWDACHIIPRTVDYELVRDVMALLFDTASPLAGAPATSALFDRRLHVKHDGVDDPANGILLSPTLHRLFDIRRTIWILRSRCYILGPPVSYEEFGAFEPPCPSATVSRGIRTEHERLELWKQQLVHETQVVPFECPKLTETQESLLHLSAVLSFFELFMAPQTAMKGVMDPPDEDGRFNPNDQSEPRKRPNRGRKNGEDNSKGPTAPEGSSGGSASGLCDEQHPKATGSAFKGGWFSRAPPASPPSSNTPSNEGSPSFKSGQFKELTNVPSTLTPVNSNDDAESRCEEDSEWDKDEERRQEILHTNIRALLIMRHNFTSGLRQFCV